MHGPGEKDDQDPEFDNSGEAFENDLEDIYGNEDSQEDDDE